MCHVDAKAFYNSITAGADHIFFIYCKNAAIIVTVEMKYYQCGSVLRCSYSLGILRKFWIAHVSFCPGLALSVTQSCFWLSHCLSLSPFTCFSYSPSCQCLSLSPIFKHLKHWGLLRDVNCTQIMFDRARREVTASKERRARERGMAEWKDNCSGEGHCDWSRFLCLFSSVWESFLPSHPWG